MQAREPANEVERVATLHDLQILDSLPEEAYDRITRLAASILDVPMAVISLVDSDRQWFKSTVGLDAKETPREFAFCAHAILDEDVMVVRDATADPRFATNPLVVEQPGLRFYAGAPLKFANGLHLGTICALDRRPRDVTPEQLRALSDLSAVVVDELRLRKMVSAHQSAIKELETTGAALRLANQGLSQFAIMASHDLRAPLSTIINMADIHIEEAAVESPPIKFIRDSASHLEDMVVGYQRLASLECGESTDVTIEDLLKDAEIQLEHVDATVESPNASLHGDRRLLTQVLTNLIVNARVHSDAETVAIEVVHVGNWTHLRCTNKMSAPIVATDDLFVPFRKGRATAPGTGLGLTIVDRVAQLHGGSVSASSTGEYFCVDMKIPKGAA